MSHQRMTRSLIMCGSALWLVLLAVQSASAQSVDLVSELTEGRRIFVPAEELDVVVEHDRRGVMLTRKKFDELIGLAKTNAKTRPNLPIVLTSSNYQAKVSGDQLLMTVTAELSQFVGDWQTTIFPTQRLSIEKATLDDQPAMLGRNQDGSITLFSNEEGKHVLKLELSTELTSQGSDQVAAFSLLRAPSGTLSLTLPAGKRLLVGALQLERPAPLDKPADYTVAIGGAPGIQLRVTDRAAENAADALTFATTGYGLHVAPGEVTWHALTSLQVFGKPVDRLTFSVPSSLEIADVESTGLESWDLTDDPNEKGRTNIALTFGQAFDGTRKISFKGVMAIETGKPWTVPPLTIANVTSHIGQVLVQHPADVRLRVEETEGVRRATQGQKPAADMPDEMSKFNATEFLRFDVWQPDFVLRLTTQPKQREVQTAVAAVLDVNATGLDLQVIVTVKTQFAPLFELDVRLPADWNVISAERDKAALKWQILSQEPGVNQLRILLDPPLPAEGSGTIHLVLRREVDGWPVESTPISVAIPELFLPQSSLNEGTIVIRGDDDLDLAASELKGLDTVPLSADFERLRFRTQDTRYGGQLKVTRKPSRISAQTITVGRLDPQTMHAFVQAMVEVQGGGVRTLRVSLPESAGTAIRFQSPDRQIIEQKSGAIQAGDRIWTLQFDQRSRGLVPLFCDIDLPRQDAKEFLVPQLRFVDAERQNGFQAIEAGGEQRITIDAKAADGTPLVEVDPLDLPNLYYAPKERIVAVYRNATAGAKVTLTEERFDKLPVPSAVCPVLSVTSVLGRTGELQHRATFQLIAVGVQGLRVILPKETVLWATLVDGQPVEVRRQGDIYLVPLNASVGIPTPQGGPHVGQSRQLQLFYRSDVPALTRFGTFEQAPPELSVQTGQGTSQPVDVLDQHWQLNYPSKTLLISSSGPLEPEQHLDETSILGRLNTGVRVPTVNELGWQVFAVIVTLGVIALLMLAYRKGRGALVALLVVFGLGYLGFVALTASQEHKNARYTVIPHYSEMVEDAYVREERYDKAPVLDPMASDSTGLPLQMDPNSTTALPQSGVPILSDSPQKPGEKFRSEASDKEVKRKGLAAGIADLRKLAPKPAAENAPREPQQQWKDKLEVAQQQFGMEPQAKQPQLEKLGEPALPASKSRLGLLSLAIDLTPPEGSLQKTFRYAGSDPARGGIALHLGYVDERSGATVRVFLVALVGLIGWFLRRSSCITKATIAALGLTLPLALLPLVPQGLQVVLDGLFFGVIVACGLWLLVAIARCIETCCATCCGWTPGNRSTKSGPVIGACVAGLLMFGADASAQPNAQPNGPAQQAEPAPPVRPEGSLIVPFDAGTDPLAADKILLPYQKFVELYRQAYPNKPLNGIAPVDGGIMAAFYSAKVVANEKTPDDSTVEVTARYAIRSYVDGQLQVELPIGAVAARDAKLDGKNAALIVNGACTKVAISSPGLHVLDFIFSVPARLSGTTGAVTLPLQPVPTGKLSFALPSKDLSVRINGSSTIFRRVTTGDVLSIEVPVDKGGDLTIAWQPEQAKGAAAAVVHVDSVQAVTLTDAGIRVSTGFQYRVRQGGVADVTLSLPATYRLQAVNGSDVGGWELQGEGDARKLRVIFRRNVSDTTQLTVEAFLDTRVGTEAVVVDLPQLAPLEVTNEIGQVAIFAGNQFTLRAEKVESLSQIDADKFTTSVPVSRPNVAPQLAYRFSKRPFTLSLRVTRQESQANVTAQQAAFVMQRKQQLTTRLVYNLTGAPRSSFNIALPAGYVVLDVKATGLHDWSLGKQGDETTLTIDLDGPRLGIAEVVLSGTVPREHTTTAAEVLFPHPTDATKLNSMAAVWLDEGFTGTLDRFDGWRSVDAGLVSGDLKAVRPDLPVQFAFQSTASAPDAIKILLQRATPRLTANGLAMVSVTDVAVVHTLALQWQIDSATTDSLVFTTPSFLAGKLEFTGTGIRETTHVDAGEGRTRWTIWLRTPVSGKYFVAAVATLPPASNEVVAPAIVFEQGNGVTTPVEGQRQYVLLINLSQSQLTSASPELTEAVQREDVPVVVDQSLVDQATELVRVKQLSTAPRWTLQTFAQTASVPASVNVADLTTIVSRDGTYRGQAIYTIKNRSRQFLALKMPDNAELLSVFVGSVPSRAVTTKRKSDTIQLIALPKTSAASLAFPVRIIWRGRLGSKLPKDARFLRQEVDIPAPIVVSQQDDPDFGIPVARTRWTVWLPDDLDAQPLKASVRNNLTLQSTDAPDLLYQKAAVQELSELLGFVEQNYSYNTRGEGRRAQATNNMKQIGLALDNAKQLSQSVGSVNGDRDFVQHRDVALKRLSDLQKSIQTDQQQLPSIATGLAIDQSGSTVRGIQLNGSFTVSPYGEQQSELSNVISNNNSLFLSNTSNGAQANSKSEVSEFSFELQNQDAEKASESKKDGGKPASAKGNVAGQQTRQSLQLGNGVNIESLNNDINAQKQAGQQGQQGQLQQLARGRGAQPGPMVGGPGPGGVPGYGVTGDSNLPSVTSPNSAIIIYPQNGQPIAQQPQGGQQGFGGQQGLWMANPVNPQAMGGGFSGGQQGGQGGFTGQLGGQFGRAGGGNFGPGSGPEGPRGYTRYGIDPGATSNPAWGMPVAGGNSNEQLPPPGRPGMAGEGVNDFALGANVDGNGFAQNAGAPVLGINPGGGAQMRMPTGGLSLGFDLPTTGKKLVFSKTGGDPKLALAVRPEETVRWGLNLVWSGIWLAMGIGIALAVRSSSMSGRLPQQLLMAIAALSILGFIVLPSPQSGCAFITFVVVALIVAWINRRTPEAI